MNSKTAESAALQRLEQHLKVDPGNPQLLADAIGLSLSLGKLDSARKYADAALRLMPNDPFVAHRNGNVLIAEGNLDEAASLFEALNARVPDPAVAFNLAFVYFRQGKYEQARSVLDPIVASDEAAPQAVTLYLRTLHHLRAINRAVEVAQRHAARCAGHADFLAVAGLLCFDADQLQLAQRFSDAALALGRRPLEAVVVAASLALARDDGAAATQLFDEALAAAPDDGRSWSGRGMASLLLGDFDAAAGQLEQATARMPGHIGTLHALGWCRILRRELPEARECFEKAIALDRNFGESHGGMAVVNALEGRTPQAQEEVKLALRLDAQGLSAKYAQMVMSGDVADPEKFKRLALRILSNRTGPLGAPLKDSIARRMR